MKLGNSWALSCLGPLSLSQPSLTLNFPSPSESFIRLSVATRHENAPSPRHKKGVSHNGPIHQTDTVFYGSQTRKQRVPVEHC